MSTLWTPGGEVPVDRNRQAAAASARPEAPPETPDEAQVRAQIEQMQRLMLERPAAEIVAQHAMGLSELAVLHLNQPEPRLGDARLAIDALAALVDGLEGRLGEAEAVLRQTLPQLRMFFVEKADRSREPASASASEETRLPDPEDPSAE